MFQMQFNPEDFDLWLANIGQELMWRQAFACPCVNPATGSAVPGCPVCHGKAWTWNDEVGPTLIGFQNIAPKVAIATFGQWSPGDATLTIPAGSPIYEAGPFDRFRAINSTNRFSSNLVRGDRDYLLGTIETFTRVFWLADDGATIVEGDMPDIDASGNLTWGAGKVSPPDGNTYSVSGTKYDEYYTYPSLPNDRNNHAGMPLPKKLLARRFDIFGR